MCLRYCYHAALNVFDNEILCLSTQSTSESFLHLEIKLRSVFFKNIFLSIGVVFFSIHMVFLWSMSQMRSIFYSETWLSNYSKLFACLSVCLFVCFLFCFILNHFNLKLQIIKVEGSFFVFLVPLSIQG